MYKNDFFIENLVPKSSCELDVCMRNFSRPQEVGGISSDFSRKEVWRNFPFLPPTSRYLPYRIREVFLRSSFYVTWKRFFCFERKSTWKNWTLFAVQPKGTLGLVSKIAFPHSAALFGKRGESICFSICLFLETKRGGKSTERKLQKGGWQKHARCCERKKGDAKRKLQNGKG